MSDTLEAVDGSFFDPTFEINYARIIRTAGTRLHVRVFLSNKILFTARLCDQPQILNANILRNRLAHIVYAESSHRAGCQSLHLHTWGQVHT